MNIKEWFTGTEEEKDAKQLIQDLSGQKLNARKRHKLRRAHEASRAISRRQFGTSIAALLALGGSAAILGNIEKSYEKAKLTPTKNPNMLDLSNYQMDGSPETIKTLMAYSQEWKKVAEEALANFSDADPRVQELLNFMNNFANYSIPYGQTSTLQMFRNDTNEDTATQQEKKAKGFEIVFMPPTYAANMPSSIMTEKGGKVMRVATTFKSKEWLGIMLAHEMSHVQDQIVHGEDATDPHQYLAGEVKAHLFEMKLLKHWNPQNYETLITEGAELYQAKNMIGLFDLIKKLYPTEEPEVSKNESGLGQASCLIAVVFELALKKGFTEEQLKAVYQKIVKHYSR